MQNANANNVQYLTKVFNGRKFSKIKIIGIGGAGSNSLSRIIEDNVNYPNTKLIVLDTDKTGLEKTKVKEKYCLGKTLNGSGAGTDPNVGQKAAIESIDDIKKILSGADMVILTAGMGGGTGTGATPIVANIAKELGILTIAIVTTPFAFEGEHKMTNAQIGIENLSLYVDNYLVVENQKLITDLPKKTTISEAFKIADTSLRNCITNALNLTQ